MTFPGAMPPEQLPGGQPDSPSLPTFTNDLSDDYSTVAKRNLDRNVAEASPALYAAGMRNGMTLEEKHIIENWSNLKTIHEKLMKMPNEKAGAEFERLDPGYQEALKDYFRIDYKFKSNISTDVDEAGWREILGVDNGMSFGDLVKSPFRLLMWGGSMYGKAFNAVGNVAQDAIVNNKGFFGKRNVSIKDAFEGKMLYDEGEASKLIDKYGGANAFAAMHLLAGDTPGEIIASWGPNDGEILKSINSLFNDPENFQVMIDDFKRVQLSPGRNIARWVNRTFNIDAQKNGGAFNGISGTIDFAYQIFADPLTYLTFGGSAILKGAGKADDLAKVLSKSGDVKSFIMNSDRTETFSAYATRIGEYTEARKSKDYVKADKIRAGISKDFPDLGLDAEIELFSSLGVKDLDTFHDAFAGENAVNLNLMLRGKTADMRFARDAMPFARKSRALTSGAKEFFHDMFKGKVDLDALDQDDAFKLYDQVEKVGREQLGLTDTALIDQQIESSRIKGFKQMFEHLSARHPGSKMIYLAGDEAAKTFEVFRDQAFLAFGSRVHSRVLTEVFKDSDPQTRFALVRGVHEMIYRRMGIHGMDGGEEKIAQWLNSSFGDIGTHGSREVLTAHPDSPLAKFNNVTEIEVRGAIQGSQFKNAVQAPEFQKAAQFVASNNIRIEKGALIRSLPKMIGGAFNTKFTDDMTSHWSALTLMPLLGIRTAIDEGFFGTLYMDIGQARDLRNARRARNVISAYTGGKEAIGPWKAAIQNITRSGPTRLIGKDDRLETKFDYLSEVGKKYDTEHEAEMFARLDLIDAALESKYGKNLPAEEAKYLKQMMVLNPSMLKASSAVHVQEATGLMKQNVFQVDALPTKLDEMMEELGLAFGPDFTSVNLKNIAVSEAHEKMYAQLFTRFNGAPLSFLGDKSIAVDPARIFLKHQIVDESRFDWDAGLDEFMEGMGFVRNGTIQDWAFAPGKIAAKRRENARAMLQSSRHFDQALRNPATLKDEVLMGQLLYRYGNEVFTDLYHVLHGNVDNFNKGLVDFLNTGGYYKASLSKLDIKTYKELMDGYVPPVRMYTNLVNKNNSLNISDSMRSFSSAFFDMASRQTDGITRQPLVHLHYMAYRKQYAGFEKQYADALYEPHLGKGKSKVELEKIRKHVDDMAGYAFAERALVDASNNVLKYADNPEIRSVFAYNMRNVGRFYRAVEDFYRRMYRLMENDGGRGGLRTIARLRLMNQGLSANGGIHTDDNGEQYMILPMDNIIYGAVNNTMRALTGNEVGVNQPIFSNLTFKLTAGNPSFQTDAGVPYLSGPMGSLSVLAAKSILGKFNPTKNMAEDIDGLFLGDFGDNITFKKAVTPKMVNYIWDILDPDERSQQEVSALTQALSYNQANGYGINLDDPKYLRADGTYDEELVATDKAKYLKDLRISAHNIIVTRILLGLVFPAAVSSKGIADVPDYLKDVGVTSMRSSFYEMVDDVKRSHPDAQDPYELALATWMGKNKGKLAYLVSTKDQKIRPMLSYSKQMQDWAIKNSDMVSKHGAGALLFAPNIGKFDPGVWNWASAAGIVDNVDIESYFDRIVMQKHVNLYYDLADQEAEELKKTSFGLTDERRAIMQTYTEKRRLMKLSTPGLENFLRSGASNEDASNFVSGALSFAKDPNSDAPTEVKNKIIEAYGVYDNFMQTANQIDMMDPANASEIKRQYKDQAIAQIRTLIDGDQSNTVKQYFESGLLKLMTSRSREAQVGIGRNI